MSKDEKIWIPDNYYQGFLRGCLANELIEETPSKTALENAGCEISALCYLITPDGKQHNPRIMKPNEFPTSIRKLFESRPDDTQSDDELEVAEPAVKDIEEIKEMLDIDPHQVCDTCQQSKSLQSFKRYPGRVARYRTTCIECQTMAKEKMPEFKQDTPPVPEPVQELSEEVIEDAVIVQTRPAVSVTLEYLKRIATEAFERGREYERSNISMIEPSLDELLGMGA